jgi:hypothetical protein
VASRHYPGIYLGVLRKITKPFLRINGIPAGFRIERSRMQVQNFTPILTCSVTPWWRWRWRWRWRCVTNEWWVPYTKWMKEVNIWALSPKKPPFQLQPSFRFRNLFPQMKVDGLTTRRGQVRRSGYIVQGSCPRVLKLQGRAVVHDSRMISDC